MPVEITPQSEADLRLAHGDQRSGKNGVCTAIVKEDYWDNLTGIMIPHNSGQIIKAKRLPEEEWMKMPRPTNPFKYVRVFSPDMKQSKVIRKPDDYMPISTTKIFANYHIFGMMAAYVGVEDVIENVDNDLFTNAFVISDESRWFDRRFNMTSEGKEMANFAATIGKRNLHFLQISQFADQLEGRLLKFATTRMYCTYNKVTKEVTVEIKEKGKPDRNITFYLPWYWTNYDTSERVPAGQYNINRALKKFREARQYATA